MKRSRSQANGRSTGQSDPLAKAKKTKTWRNTSASSPTLDDSDQQQGRPRNKPGDQQSPKQQPSSELFDVGVHRMKRSRSQANGRSTGQSDPLAKAKKTKTWRNTSASSPTLDDSDQQQGRPRNKPGDQQSPKQQPSSELFDVGVHRMKRSRSQANGRSTGQSDPLAKAKKTKTWRNTSASSPPLDDSDQQQGRPRNKPGDQQSPKQQPSSELGADGDLEGSQTKPRTGDTKTCKGKALNKKKKTSNDLVCPRGISSNVEYTSRDYCTCHLCEYWGKCTEQRVWDRKGGWI